MHFLLLNAKAGISTDRWFAIDVGVHSRAEDSYHYLNARLVAAPGTWFGPGIANPQYLKAGNVKPILDWIREKRSVGKNCGILPSEFGGGPGDYQLVEEEDDRGQTRLSLLVHPKVGEID